MFQKFRVAQNLLLVLFFGENFLEICKLKAIILYVVAKGVLFTGFTVKLMAVFHIVV